jgi:CBS domain-containing protein
MPVERLAHRVGLRAMTLKSFLTPRPERNETPLLALRREIDRLFDEFGRAWTTPDIVGLTPRINMLQREGHTELTIELPGFDQKDVEVSVGDDMLTITGKKRSESDTDDAGARVQERSYTAFSHSFELPPGTEAGDVKVQMDKGVLSVTWPKAGQLAAGGPMIESGIGAPAVKRPTIAADIMVTNVITIDHHQTVQEAARMLLDHHISGLPVVDGNGHLVGLISEGDLMRRTEIGTEKRRSWWLELFTSSETRASDYVKSNALLVEDVMTKRLIMAQEDTPLSEIATLLERHGIKRVPIVRDGKLVGIVSRSNLLQAFASASVERMQPRTGDDRETRERVLEQMKAAPGGMPWLLTVTVDDGVAELRGPVSSEEQRAALRVAAETTPGVRAVKDEMYRMPRVPE